MKAMVLESAGAPLLCVEREVPEAAPGEAVLRVKGSCLNYHDLSSIDGRIPGLPYPRVPLSDGCGEVVALGAGVSRVAIGQRVSANFSPDWIAGPPTPEARRHTVGDTMDGWLQQYMKVPAHSLVKIPAHLSNLEAACLPCAGVTAWRSVAVDTRTGPGDWVVVQGTGGVAIFALQFAKALGAHVIVTSSSDAKLERAAKLGADHGINYRTTPDWPQQVLEITGGRGADLVVDNGGPATLGASVEALCMGGHVSIIGVLSGYGKAEIPLITAMQRNVTLQGVTVGSRQDFDSMLRAIEAYALRPAISHVFGMEEIPRAQEVMVAGEHLGKIAIEIP